MNDLTRALCHRIQWYRKLYQNSSRQYQVLWRTNRERVASLASAMGLPGNRDANWDDLITCVIGLRLERRELSSRLKNTMFEVRADKNELTLVDMAFLVENGWTPAPGTGHIPCRKIRLLPCHHSGGAGHDGHCVATF